MIACALCQAFLRLSTGTLPSAECRWLSVTFVISCGTAITLLCDVSGWLGCPSAAPAWEPSESAASHLRRGRGVARPARTLARDPPRKSWPAPQSGSIKPSGAAYAAFASGTNGNRLQTQRHGATRADAGYTDTVFNVCCAALIHTIR